MRNPDNIDLLYILEPHGWGKCLLYLDCEIHQMDISYVFGDPIYDCIEAILLLLKGMSQAEFIWWDEPGGCRWQLLRDAQQHHKIKITITQFANSYGSAIKDEEMIATFEIKLSQFAALIYYQMKKLAVLLQTKSFEATRSGHFPYHQLTKLAALMEE
jgi:hypothetical protein